MLNQLLGETLARPMAEAWLANKSPRECARSLVRLYGLTAAEASFTLDLLEGKGLSWAASQNGVSLNTARTHLKHVFEKTRTHRQAELVRLILRSPAFLRLS